MLPQQALASEKLSKRYYSKFTGFMASLDCTDIKILTDAIKQ